MSEPAHASLLGWSDGTALTTLPQVLLDGANGVDQASRLDPGLAVAQVVVFAAALGLFAWLLGRSSPRRGGTSTLLLLAIGILPGAVHVLALRADSLTRQRDLVRDVRAHRQAYLHSARAALARLPASGCHVRRFDQSCLPYLGIRDGVEHLLPGRRCLGGESPAIVVESTSCSPQAVHVRGIDARAP